MKVSSRSSRAVVSVAFRYISSFVSIVSMSSAASFCSLLKFANGFVVDPGGYDIGEVVGEGELSLSSLPDMLQLL